MTIPANPKPKKRPFRLRSVLLVLVIGLVFALWMPLMIVTPTGLHWLNYVIYWAAAWAWLIPFMRWMRLPQSRSWLHRMTVFVGLLLIWLGANFGGAVTSGHWLLPFQHSQHNGCIIGRHRHYECYLWELELPASYTFRYGPLANHGFLMRITAQQLAGLPIARVTAIQSGLYPANEAMTW